MVYRIFLLLLTGSVSQAGLGQEYVESLTPEKALLERRFDFCFSHGAHLANPLHVRDRYFNSRLNFSLDFKVQARPHWFVGVTNRLRADYYYLPIPNHSLTQSEVLNEYIVWSHALYLEKRFVWKKFYPFVSLGLGVTFTHASGIGWRYNVNPYSAQVTFNDYFITARAPNGHNLNSLFSTGLDYHVTGKLFIRPTLSLAYVHGGLRPILPTTVMSSGQTYLLVPGLRRFHPVAYIGVAYKFNW